MEPFHDKRRFKGEQTKARILYAAIELIAENSIREVSTARIAAASGVSKSTIFHHFPASDVVLTHALQLVFDEMLRSIRQVSYRNLEDFLRTLGHLLMLAPESERTLIKAFVSFTHESLFNPVYREILAGYVEQMENFFRTELTRLAPRQVDPHAIEAAALMLLPVMDGIGFHFLLKGDAKKYSQIWKSQADMICCLLRDTKQVE